jgi:hypothetical protein
LVSTRETALKVRNLRRDERLWLCVLPDGFFGRWIQVDGSAEIVSSIAPVSTYAACPATRASTVLVPRYRGPNQASTPTPAANRIRTAQCEAP